MSKFQNSNLKLPILDKLEKRLEEIKRTKKIGIMTHVVVGYPNLAETVELVKLMEKCGVDFVELQIPFSDPLADGPTIMKACEVSLKNSTRVKDSFEIVKNLNNSVKIPLLFMCYYNTIFKYGIERFCRDAKEVGISGLIVPDMPIDEESSERFYFFAQKYDLHTIQVISPVTTQQRLKKIAQVANGFVYCTARQGITGVRKELDATVENYLETVKGRIELPLAVGFGISEKKHVEALVGHADIAVVGSKILSIINSRKDYKREVEHFLRQLNMLK